jgi:Holliday junction resolvase RusA-like endonuclease
MEIRHFSVPGRPQAKERPRMSYGRAYTPKKTKEYEAKVYANYKAKHGSKPKLTGLLRVEVFIYFDKNNHGDVDNYIKIALDGLNGAAWNDDKQVREVVGYLVVDKAEPQRMEVTIRELEDTFPSRVATKLLANVTEQEEAPNNLDGEEE